MVCASPVLNVETWSSLQFKVHISEYRDGVESTSFQKPQVNHTCRPWQPDCRRSRPSPQWSRRLALLCAACQLHTAAGRVVLLKLQHLSLSFSYMALPARHPPAEVCPGKEWCQCGQRSCVWLRSWWTLWFLRDPETVRTYFILLKVAVEGDFHLVSRSFLYSATHVYIGDTYPPPQGHTGHLCTRESV